MSRHYCLDVTLTLLGPLLTRGGEMCEPGIDASLARDGRGRYMLPFSLIKGKVLDALREMCPGDFENDPAQRRYGPKSKLFIDWFGQEPRDGTYDPERGRLRFSDFHTDQTGTASDDVIERIKIDAATGAAAGRMLMMIEAPFGYGEEVRFEGRVEFVASPPQAKEIESYLRAAFDWVPAYGAMKTVGFGRTKNVKIVARVLPEGQVAPISATDEVSDLLGLRLTLDRPLCVVGRKHSRNHFESLELLGGAVLKGAVARLLREVAGGVSDIIEGDLPGFSALSRHFTALRFVEARPSSALDGRRPVVPPLSLAFGPDNRFVDFAGAREACLIQNTAPLFLPDWKGVHWAKIQQVFGWPETVRERRTRTAIEPPRGRAADERLFSYGLVLPEIRTAKGSIAPLYWLGAVGLADVPPAERAAVVNQLKRLLATGLPHLGKTRATATVEWLPQPNPPAVSSRELVPITSNDTPAGNASLPVAATYVVVLQTECLMTDPALLSGNPVKALRDAYESFWSEVSDGALRLAESQIFARQALYGGFLASRTARRRIDPSPASDSNGPGPRAGISGQGPRYEPFLLTERGSTFVLEAVEQQKAVECLARWRVQGLPTAKWVAQRYQRHGQPLWRTCPFLPHVGYGEIAVDLQPVEPAQAVAVTSN